ncbi:hypothetical protein V3W47_00805 [Deinococcus sp. YIM 134068]|uniref:hypothetical protein n=1 Tax=Deinococcus lichenicola TaxID=3118910 RepID=UPI002F94A00A
MTGASKLGLGGNRASTWSLRIILAAWTSNRGVPRTTPAAIALILAGSAGTFVFVALWLAASLHVLLAVLGGLAAGALMRLPASALLAIFRR